MKRVKPSLLAEGMDSYAARAVDKAASYDFNKDSNVYDKKLLLEAP